jgi:[acyl-carrier-protein] S-malonyltransferase
VVNNIDVAVETDPTRIRDALYRQAYGPVRWVEVVQALKAAALTHVVECGPGKVLSAWSSASTPDLPGRGPVRPGLAGRNQGTAA